MKNTISKPIKHNKNVGTLLFPLSFTKCQREQNIERTFFVSEGTQKGWGTAGSGRTLPQYLLNRKNKFPVKSIFTYLPYFQMAEKLRQFH